jgi:hypothetical protein
LNPPFYLEMKIHFDKPHKLYAAPVIPNIMVERVIMYGPDVDLLFSMISLMYSRVLLDWAEEDEAVQKQALLRISKSDMEPCRV